MQPFIHLHVHSQYSVLDGQASVKALVDKAIADGMPGLALTDHGNMFGIKEFHDYCNKKNGDFNATIKQLKKQLKELDAENEENRAKIEELKAEIKSTENKRFKPIFGCEMYVAEKSLHERTSKHDTGRHLVVLAKNSV